VTTHFTIDLLRPGRGQRSSWDWFVGDDGSRHLALIAAGGVALIAVIAIGGVVPRHLRYSNELKAIEALKRDVATAQTEESMLRASLRDLAAEARRQVRWSELLPALSREVPDSIRLERVSFVKPVRSTQGAQPQQAEQTTKAGAQPVDMTLKIEANTSVMPGGSRLVEIAKFMAALAQDPTIVRRFELKTWELRQARDQGRDQEGQLQINIDLAEKRS
jgi:hypothetical protein